MHRGIVHRTEDDLGFVTRGVVNRLADLRHFTERQVLAARDVDEHARRTGDRDVVEQRARNRLLRRFHRAVLAAPLAGPHQRRAAILHHGTDVRKIYIDEPGDTDER